MRTERLVVLAALVTATVAFVAVPTPASAKVIGPQRPVYKATLAGLAQVHTQFAGSWTATAGAVAERLATCPTDPLDPSGMGMLADATRATGLAFHDQAFTASYLPAGMSFTSAADRRSVKRAGAAFRLFGTRGRDALALQAHAFEAMGSGDCAGAQRDAAGAAEVRQDAEDSYKGAMAQFRRQV
jgi:hypothetical protein